MERTETQEWITSVAIELCEKVVAQGLKKPYHLDVHDDSGHGRVCSFEMDDGKTLWWAWNGDVVEVCEWPLKITLTSSDGEWRSGWIRSTNWQLAR